MSDFALCLPTLFSLQRGALCRPCVEAGLAKHGGCPTCKALAWRQDAAPQPSMVNAVAGVRHVLSLLRKVHAAAGTDSPQHTCHPGPPAAHACTPPEAAAASCTGSPDSSSLPPASPLVSPVPEPKVFLLASALNKTDAAALSQLQQLVAPRLIQCAGSRPPAATHVVVGSHAHTVTSASASASSSASAGDPFTARRTIKYCCGVLSGAWVLTAAWIHDSLAAGKLLPEAAYEVRGDHVARGAARTSRLALAGGSPAPRLFHGVCFLVDPLELRPKGSAQALMHMLQTGGGQVLQLTAGRPCRKRQQNKSLPALRPAEVQWTVRVADIRRPAVLSLLPRGLPRPTQPALTTTAVLNCVSFYSATSLKC